MRTPSPNAPKRALRARDAGLRKISVTTRVLAVGSVAAAGAFASLAAWAQPGHAKVIRTAAPSAGRQLGSGASTATVPPTTPPIAPSDDDGGDYYLTPPPTVPDTVPAPDPGYQYQAPSYQYQPPPVVSGAS